ncbi:hypothetical protein [Stieleria magnilauensis]
MHNRNQDAIASTTQMNCGQLNREADSEQAAPLLGPDKMARVIGGDYGAY